MADDKSKVGKADRDRVSQEPWEVEYLVKKFKLGKDVVLKEIQAHGPMRAAVEAALERHLGDDKTKTGKADRERVAAGEAYEVEYLVKKFGAAKDVVLEAIKKHGPMRKDVEAALEKHGSKA